MGVFLLRCSWHERGNVSFEISLDAVDMTQVLSLHFGDRFHSWAALNPMPYGCRAMVLAEWRRWHKCPVICTALIRKWWLSPALEHDGQEVLPFVFCSITLSPYPCM